MNESIDIRYDRYAHTQEEPATLQRPGSGEQPFGRQSHMHGSESIPASGAAMTLDKAISAYKAEMRRAAFKATSFERYSRELERFAQFHGGGDTLLHDVATPAACRAFLEETFDDHAPSTISLECTILSSWFAALVMDEHLDHNPMVKVRRPKVPKERDVCRLSEDQVAALLDACQTWAEMLCLSTLAYMGVRRTALAGLRWGDVDGKEWTATFSEKGGKLIRKPVPVELRKVWTAYWIEQGPFSADDFVVPNKVALGYTDRRSPRIVYILVRDVSERVGIHATCHAFRRAYATRFLRQNPGQIETLRYLMGHESIETTSRYLDDVRRDEAMQTVVDLSFGAAPVTERQLGVAA